MCDFPRRSLLILTLSLVPLAAVCIAQEPTANSAAKPGHPSCKPRALVGAYYWDGWSAEIFPCIRTRRLVTEFAGREPAWEFQHSSIEPFPTTRYLVSFGGQGIRFVLCRTVRVHHGFTVTMLSGLASSWSICPYWQLRSIPKRPQLRVEIGRQIGQRFGSYRGPHSGACSATAARPPDRCRDFRESAAY